MRARSNGKKTMAQEAYDVLEAEIVSQRLQPGSRLIEDDVAERLGLSRTPVREAFKMLERAGWIEVQAHAGATVRSPSLDDLGEAFTLRNLLENEVARLASRRATPQDVRELRRIVRQGRAGAAEPRAAAMTRLNQEFHDKLIAIAGNRLLSQFLGTVYQHLRWYFAGSVPDDQVTAWEQHAAIVDAVERGDSDAAVAVMKEHADRTRAAYVAKFLAAGG